MLDLTLRRFRQTIAVITETKISELKAANRLMNYQLKTVCSFIAATVPTEKGEENALLRAASQIGEKSDKPNEGTPKKVDPSLGSFERLMGAFSGKPPER